jgi:hypothetical protein
VKVVLLVNIIQMKLIKSMMILIVSLVVTVPGAKGDLQDYFLRVRCDWNKDYFY